ncbi:MAG: hypothetical protein J2P45_05570 [Candidatus Dormibacteraeota bacterium]|nr:hypothetical protein [Candidatus Dormibacteraeota bacterium]
MAVIPHPLGGIGDAELAAKAEAAWPLLRAWLEEPPSDGGETRTSLPYTPSPHRGEGQGEAHTPPAPERFLVSGDEVAVTAWLEERGLTDGLPVVAPTEERVAAMVAASGLDPAESLGAVPPRQGEAIVERLAANAVMAGLRPERFGILLAAVRAVLQPEFNLDGVQATTHPVAPLVVVHGPVARRLGVQGGSGALGPGFSANATIGRALRLVLLNVGGARPGEGDLSTHGGPAKFTYCLTENVSASPWPEFHTGRGFGPSDGAVTVFAGEAPHNVNDHQSQEPEPLLDLVADVMRTLGHNTWYRDRDGRNEMLVILSPEHAEVVARRGWGPEQVQSYLFERSARSPEDLRRGGMWEMRNWPEWLEQAAVRGEPVHPARSADGILLMVAGGPGKHSVVIPGFGSSLAVTVAA